jgi:hypothetical protein
MNYLILIIVAVSGIYLGMYFSDRKNGDGLISRQSKKKEENKKKILEFLQRNEKVQNNDVEKMAGVSNVHPANLLWFTHIY